MGSYWHVAALGLLLAGSTVWAQAPGEGSGAAAEAVPTATPNEADAVDAIAPTSIPPADDSAGGEAPTIQPTSDPAAGDEEPASLPSQPVSVAATVRVVRALGSGDRAPVPGAEVSLRGAREGQAVTPQQVVTNSEGVARLALAVDGTRWVASVQEEGLTFMSADVLVGGETDEVVVTVYERTADPSALRIDRLVTLGRIHESYLIFETYWFISVAGPYVFQAEIPAEGLEVRFPEGVEGIHVIEPTDGSAVAGDTGVTLLGPFGPPGVLPTDGPSLFATFSLPHEATRHEFAMPMPLPLDEAIIILPQTTEFERYPELDVDLQVPVCGAGVDTSEFVCFHNPQSLPVGQGFMPNIDRREIHGGHGEAGSMLTFATVGWPAQRDPFRLAALFGMVVLLLGGVIAFRRYGRSAGSEPARTGHLPERRLQQERHRLLGELKRAEEEYEAGVLPLPDFEATSMILRHRLETVYEALGVAPDGDEAESDSADSTR